MFLLYEYPLQILIIFSIPPTILGLYSYFVASQNKEKRSAQEQEAFVQASIRRGVVYGLVADIVFLCIILVLPDSG